MSTFHLSITTPNGKVFENDITFLSAPGQEGSVGILARHAPMITLLKSGNLKIERESQKEFFQINRGILEVDYSHNVLLLADEALKLEGNQTLKKEDALAH